MTLPLVYLCLLSGILSALVAGVFQAFSDFVMAGLVRARPAAGIDSMQQLNRTVYRSVFLAMLLLLVPLTAGLSFYAWFRLEGTDQFLILLGGAVYFLSVFVITIVCNVPMNKKLDIFPPDSPEAETYWTHYGRVWTKWNHVRTIGSAAAAACFLLASVSLN